LVLKIKIARFLIVFGFLLNIATYGLELIDFYGDSTFSVSHVLEDAEDKSESNETDNSEKEELREKDKISQFYSNRNFKVCDIVTKLYPEVFMCNLSVYLEYKTPPPEFI